MNDADLPHLVIGACMNVHRALGPGLLRDAYDECLAIELREMEFDFKRNLPLQFDYHGRRVKTGAYLDFVIGGVLLFSAWQLLVRIHVEQAARLPRVPVALATGAALGLLSGLTGTGGGIFLTPLLLLMGWATPKTAAAVSALFILMNSTTGLIGNVVSTGRFPDFALPLLLAAGVGGLAGAHFGSHRASSRAIKALLAAVLVVAGIKLLLF